VASADAHTRTQSRSMLVSSKLVPSRFLRHIAAGQGRYLPDDTVQFVSLTHIVATAELENNNYRMIVDHTHYSCSVTQFRHGVTHSPVCTITAVSKDLVRGRLVISYNLSLATLSHELGVSLADSARSAGKLLDQLRDA